MKYRFLLLLAVVATVFAFSSCSKDEPKEPEYTRCSYDVTVEDGLSAIYDFTITTTTADGEVQETPFLYQAKIVSWRESPKPFKVTFKLVGKLKPDAAAIIDELAKHHVIINEGYSYLGIAAVYSDKEYNNMKRTFYFKSEGKDHWISPNDLKQYLSQPTLVLFDVSEK